MTAEQTSLIPIDQLHESPFNPRKLYSDARLQELADSIKIDGVLQPIVVRPKPGLRPLLEGHDTFSDFEIVFGHRRFRAAQLAGLKFMPSIVRAMDDVDVKRAQIVENLQRVDVHPIEEAEGFLALMNDHLQSADDIVRQTSKSRSYVYGRLKLLQACAEVRAACLAGEIGSEVALLIARLRTDKLQAKALGYIKGKYIDLGDGGAKSFRAIRSLLNERFTLELKGALFDTTDDTLLPAAGNCTACTKRTGNAPEFSDVADPEGGPKSFHHNHLRHRGADVCTDPDCFDAKKKAYLKREAQALQAHGKTVVDGNKARAAVDAYGRLKDGYLPLSEVREALKKAKDKQVETVHIQDPRTGKVVQAVKRDDAIAAGLVRKPSAQGASGRAPDIYARERAKRDEKARIESAVRKAVLLQVRARIAESERGLFDLQLLASNAIDGLDPDGRTLLQEIRDAASWQAVEDSVATLTAPELSQLMLDVALCHDVTISGYELEYGNHSAKPLFDAAAHYCVDVAAIRAELAPTPSTAARAPTGATAAAGKAKSRQTVKRMPLAASMAQDEAEDQEQTDDAGVTAGASVATADAN